MDGKSIMNAISVTLWCCNSLCFATLIRSDFSEKHFRSKGVNYCRVPGCHQGDEVISVTSVISGAGDLTSKQKREDLTFCWCSSTASFGLS